MLTFVSVAFFLAGCVIVALRVRVASFWISQWRYFTYAWERAKAKCRLLNFQGCVAFKHTDPKCCLEP